MLQTMEFGKKLSSFLRSKDLTQKQFAKEIGMSENSISQIINGRKPTFSFLEKFYYRFPEIDISKMLNKESQHIVSEERITYGRDRIRHEVEKLKESIEKLDQLTRI